MKFLQMKDWDEWQSFRKDRGAPPWIKVHRKVLTSTKWARLTDSDKGQLLSIWLIAADNGGIVTSDPLLLQKICMLDTAPEINKFIDLGLMWLTDGCQVDAKMTPSGCQVDANLTHQRISEDIRPNQTKEKDIKTLVERDASDPVVEVFEFWQVELNHKQTVLSDDRRKKIKARLQEGYSVERIKQAIQGIKRSSHNMGENDRNQKYDDIELICRTGSNVDRFADMLQAEGPCQKIKMSRYARAGLLDKWDN